MTGKRIDQDAADAYPLHVLREYALLADGERGALVGPRADIVWMCAPRWDSAAVFSSLIGGSGMYAITPGNSPRPSPAGTGASRAHGMARFLTGSMRGTILPSGPS